MSTSKDESNAYLEFLNDEVLYILCKADPHANVYKAQKFSRAIADEDGDELHEESVLLESPLDQLEVYELMRGTLMSKSSFDVT